MKKHFRAVLIFAAFLIFVNFVSAQSTPTTVPQEVDSLWKRNVEPWLSLHLWKLKPYDAGHFLMVPLHAAFYYDNEEWINQFAQHFDSLTINYDEITESHLHRLQYFYLVSRFLVLAQSNGYQNIIPKSLFEITELVLEQIWWQKPAWQWAQTDFETLRQRAIWKLSSDTTFSIHIGDDYRDNKLKINDLTFNRTLVDTFNTQIDSAFWYNFEKSNKQFYKENIAGKTYQRLIIDEDLFCFAIAADLINYRENSGQNILYFLRDIRNLTYWIMQERITRQANGGWLFQQGIYWNHPDYVYAGHQQTSDGLQPLPVFNLGQDILHFHRFPLWLQSFQQSWNECLPEYSYYQNLRETLVTQIFDKVLIPPTDTLQMYIANNYVCGTNGLYRWNYKSLDKNTGYEPYQGTHAIYLGWYSFLPTPKMKDVYASILPYFPLSQELQEQFMFTQQGKQNKVVNMGFYELIARLIVKMKTP